jgi:beta-glucosidase/6-phospho-beta-glucosidase/beta-galactosidase
MGFSIRFSIAKVNFSTGKRYLRSSTLVFRETARSSEMLEELLFD